MTKEEFEKRLNEEWKKKVFNDYTSLPITKNFGLFFCKKDEETGKIYWCYAGIDRTGHCYVHAYDSEEECDIKEMPYLNNPIWLIGSRIKDKIRDIKFNIKCYFQRARKGYCEKDLYGLDHWFLRIVPKMLRELKDRPSFYPIDKNGDAIDIHCKDPDKILGEANNWSEMLEAIASGFERARYNDDINPYDIIKDREKHYAWEKEKYNYKEEELKKAFEKFIKYFRHLGW